MRINKYIASTGFCSRRKAEQIIFSGRVKVNGKRITELSTQVDENNDKVMIDDKVIRAEERKIYILLNKPEGYITTAKDQFDRKSVIDLVDVKERVYPVGRLDYETSGLLILTNDGDLTMDITHPSKKIAKVYRAIVKGKVSEKSKVHFENGLEIEDYITSPAKMKILKYDKINNRSFLEVTIYEGRNRQVRKMLRKIGNPVLRLRRVGIGGLRDSSLEIGKCRELTKEEINMIFK